MHPFCKVLRGKKVTRAVDIPCKKVLNDTHMDMNAISTTSTLFSPFNVQVFLDVLNLVIAAYIIYQVMRAALGGLVGKAFQLIAIGIAVLGVNHIADSLFLAPMLREMGHVHDYLQPPIVHRFINFIGFAFLAWGFTQLKLSRR